MQQAKHKTIMVRHLAKIENHAGWIKANRVSKLDKRTYPSKFIDFDFLGIVSIEPYHIAPLACMIYEYQEQGYTVRVVNMGDIIGNYLSSFNFLKFCSGDSGANNWPSPISRTTLPLWRIEPEAANIYHKKVQEYFENNLLDDKELSPLSNSLGELMNNVFDHSQSKIPGYTFTQLDESKHQIITSVCDFGITIPKKVNTYLKANGKDAVSAKLAVLKAMENGFSTKSTPRNRGYGLHNMLSEVQYLHGKVLIVSGMVIYWQMQDGREITQEIKRSFPGTLIVIYLDTRKLMIKEEEISDEMQAL